MAVTATGAGIAAGLRASARNRTVLVVEDERAIRGLLQLHLQNAGYDVVVAEDAIQGGKRLLEGGIDLLVIDAQLPYFSGIEFASTVMADTSLPSLPIIMITGHDELVLRAERLGLPCLVNPFGADCLISLVASSLVMPQTDVVAIDDVRARRRA